MLKKTNSNSILVVGFILFLSVSLHGQNFDNNTRVFNETQDTNLTKTVSDDDLPELFDKKLQQVSASASDSIDTDVNGFRVQIYKTETMSDSKEKQLLYSEMFGDSNVKLVFEEPFYKIRIGNFLTRNEAEDYQEELLRNGFRSSIIVPDKITVRIAKKK